jgi:hypothetical protein
MRTTRSLAIALAALALGACSTATNRDVTVESGGSVATGDVIPTNDRSLPTGATLVARLDQTLGTKESKAGDTFTATVASDLRAQDNSVVIPAGAKIHGRVTATDDSDNAGEPALIRLAFDRISFNGQSHPFAAQIVRANPTQTMDNSGTDRGRNVIIGGAVGAALGGLLGDGDLKNIVIGGALGAAAGSIVSLGSEVNASLPAGSTMTLRTTQSTMLR